MGWAPAVLIFHCLSGGGGIVLGQAFSFSSRRLPQLQLVLVGRTEALLAEIPNNRYARFLQCLRLTLQPSVTITVAVIVVDEDEDEPGPGQTLCQLQLVPFS